MSPFQSSSRLTNRYFRGMAKQVKRLHDIYNKFFMTAPSYDDELQDEIWTNPNWIKLKPSRRHPRGRTTTYLYENEIKLAAKPDSWIIILIEGPMDSGKSYVAFSIATDIKAQISKNTDGEIDPNVRYFKSATKYMDDTQFKKLKAGDINIIDDLGVMSGEGSATETIGLMNIIKMTRQAGLLRTIIICPDFGANRRKAFAKVVTCILKIAGSLSYRARCPNCRTETVFWHERCMECQQKHPTLAPKWEQKRVTRCIHFKTNDKPRGFIYHPIPTDETMDTLGYREFKSSLTQDIIDQRGMITRAMDPEIREFHARNFITKIKADKYWDAETDINKSILKSFKDYIPLHTSAQEAIVTYAYRMLLREQSDAEEIPIDDDDNIPSVRKTPMVPRNKTPLHDKGFRKHILQHLSSKPKVLFVMTRQFRGMTNASIAEDYREKYHTKTITNTVSAWINEWSKANLGGLFEIYFRRIIGDKRIMKRAAAKTPDAIGKDGKIYSLKSSCRMQDAETFDPSIDFRPEWDRALKQGKTFFFVLAHPTRHEHLQTLEIDPSNDIGRRITYNYAKGIFTRTE